MNCAFLLGMTITNMKEAVAALRSITDRAEQEGSRMGFFSALYARVTMVMAARIHQGFFDDPPLMDRLSAAFVDLYADAASKHLSRRAPVPAAWNLAFDACTRPAPAILEHIYLAMNAHVMIDLPIAVSAVGDRARIKALRGDFLKINQVITSLMHGFHEDLCEVSPRLSQFKRFTGPLWALGSQAVLFTARRRTFHHARRLAETSGEQHRLFVESLDMQALSRGRTILGSTMYQPLFRAIRAKESNDVPGIIRTLKGRSW